MHKLAGALKLKRRKLGSSNGYSEACSISLYPCPNIGHASALYERSMLTDVVLAIAFQGRMHMDITVQGKSIHLQISRAWISDLLADIRRYAM
jgi:hypothetical protein